MKKKLLKIAQKILKGLQKMFYIISIILGMYTFTYKKPFFLALGFMLILWGLLLSPLMDKTFDNPRLSFYKKLLIFIGIYLIMAYSVKFHSSNYVKVFVTLFTMIEYFLMIVISSFKKKVIKNGKV